MFKIDMIALFLNVIHKQLVPRRIRPLTVRPRIVIMLGRCVVIIGAFLRFAGIGFKVTVIAIGIHDGLDIIVHRRRFVQPDPNDALIQFSGSIPRQLRHRTLPVDRFARG